MQRFSCVEPTAYISKGIDCKFGTCIDILEISQVYCFGSFRVNNESEMSQIRVICKCYASCLCSTYKPHFWWNFFLKFAETFAESFCRAIVVPWSEN